MLDIYLRIGPTDFLVNHPRIFHPHTHKKISCIYEIDQMRFFWENTFFSYSNQWVIDNESLQFTPKLTRSTSGLEKTSSERKCVLTQSHRNVWLSKSLLMAYLKNQNWSPGGDLFMTFQFWFESFNQSNRLEF